MKIIFAIALALLMAACTTIEPPNTINMLQFKNWQERARATPPIEIDNAHSIKELILSFNYVEEESDYWKTPDEFFADGDGDCEDFALTAYWLGKGNNLPSILYMVDHNHMIAIVDGVVIDNRQKFDYQTYQEIAR